ncbi:hypothetical protein JGY85_04245 [Shigella sonnei]|nr:hypothetical protein [Shigella sonnei]
MVMELSCFLSPDGIPQAASLCFVAMIVEGMNHQSRIPATRSVYWLPLLVIALSLPNISPWFNAIKQADESSWFSGWVIKTYRHCLKSF